MRLTANMGYTLLEVMIVMSISAMMFLVAIAAFSGRQEDVQFSQAVRAFDARLQDTINDVSTGFFDNDGDYTCVVADPSNPASEPSLVTPATSQGTSDDCIFLGKVLQFYPDGTNEHTVNIYNVIGRRNNASGLSVNNLDEANPVAAVNGATPADEVQTISLDWGLRVTAIENSASPVQAFGAVGFMTSFARSVTIGDDKYDVSVNNAVRYGGIPSTGLGTTDLGQAVSSIANIGESNFTGNEIITICLQSAAQSKRAAIVIGKDGTTDTTMQFDDYDTSICGT